ncbi:hypothetical protein ACJIZ3_009608 [Penstemon smallii]|uniref:Uncharacterized protein n=1 Tax=Penstemon smallii TaxID=265156 RepID=A0ABD3TCZ8_9LAMI
MAASSCTSITLLLNNKSNKSASQSYNKRDQCSFLGGDRRLHDLQCGHRAARIRTNKNMDLVVRNATPEVAADLVSSTFSNIPGFSLIADNPWASGLAGLFVAVPFVIQRLVILSKEVDMAAETVEKIADTVGKVAEQVDKAAEDIAESLPEGGLKNFVGLVEDIAEETTKDAQKVEDLMDKVEELDDKLEAFLNKQSKGVDKA